eukprot:Platyproteum_vivax@DN3124_c0_g1_i1.p1
MSEDIVTSCTSSLLESASQISFLEQEVQVLRVSQDSLTQELQKTKAQLMQEIDRKLKIETLLEQKQLEASQMHEDDVQRLQVEIRQLKGQLFAVRQCLTESKQKINQLEHENGEAKRELQDLDMKKDLENSATIEAQIESVQQESQRIKSQLDQDKTIFTTLEGHKNSLQEEFLALQLKHEELKSTLAVVKQGLKQEESTRVERQAKIAQSEETIASQNAQIVTYKGEIHNMSKKLFKMEQKLATATLDYDQAKALLQKVFHDKAKLHAVIKNNEDEMEELKAASSTEQHENDKDIIEAAKENLLIEACETPKSVEPPCNPEIVVIDVDTAVKIEDVKQVF